MAPPPVKQSTESDHKLAFKIIDAITTTVKVVCKYGWPCVCVYFAFRIVEVLAGRTTDASFALKLAVSVFGNDRVMKSICAIVSGGSIGYGVGQKRLRQRDIQRLTPRPRQLETVIDRRRTSSGLTTKGTTRPEDET